MPQARPSPANQISWEQFECNHSAELSAFYEFLGWTGPETSKPKRLADGIRRPHRNLPRWAEEMKRSPLISLLATAGRENCRDAFNDVLYLGLRRLGVKVPSEVFVEPAGKRGRPMTTEGVYELWKKLGQPPLAGPGLAAAVYGQDFRSATADARKRMIDRCRKTVARHTAKDTSIGRKSMELNPRI